MAHKQKMNESELAAYLGLKVQNAMNRADGDLSDVRENLFAQYYGAKQGNEREGFSSFVTREVMEVVEWAVPSIVRIFTGADRVVSFDPVGPEDEEAAEQETDIINHAVNQANGSAGFTAMTEFIRDAVLNPTAYAKVWMEEKTVRMVHEDSEISAEQLAEMVDNDDVELLDYSSEKVKVGLPFAPGGILQLGSEQEIEVEMFDVRYRETKKEQQMRFVGVPPEEVLVDPELTSLNLDDAAFVCHRSRKRYTELVDMGYPASKLDKVGDSQDDVTWNEERVGRNFYEDESPSHNNEADAGTEDAMRMLWVYEFNVWVDYDGDGIAEYRRVVKIGEEIFENEETNYQPLVAMSSILVPHKHNGLSLGQLVQDVQVLLSELTRQLINNVRDINTRRRYVGEDAFIEDGRTYAGMVNPAASVVQVRGIPSDLILPDVSTPIIGDLLPVIQDFRASTSLRTGVSPETSIDPAVLQQSTYGAFMGAMERANERLELVARTMAETGIKQVYQKFHQLHRMHPDVVKAVRMRNKWVDVDPKGWRDRPDVKINVGLGFANKQQQLSATMQAIELQRPLMELGLADAKNIYNLHADFVKHSGLGDPEFLFKDPAAEGWQPPPPPPPSPEQMLIISQAEAVKVGARTEQMKVQRNAEVAMKKLEVEAMKAQAEVSKVQAEAQMAMAEIGIKERERQSRDRENTVEALKTVAEIDKVENEVVNVAADSALKRAQTVKALSDSKKAEADAKRPTRNQR